MIGVIGAAGVAATNKLCELIERKMTQAGAFRDAHHPEMIIWQATQVPSRSLYYEGRGDSFIPGYIEIGKAMKSCGVTKIAMCCNTAHMAIDEISEAVGVPFINLIQEVASRVHELKAHKIGIICSDSLSKFKFYDRFIINDHDDIRTIYPDDKYQRLVTEGICNAKSGKRFLPIDDNEHPYSLFTKVVSHLEGKGVDCIVAGCTDIRNVFKPDHVLMGNVDYIDCLEILADTIIKESYEKNSNNR